MKVGEDGSVEIQGDMRMLYSTMLKVRNMIVVSSKYAYIFCLTAAIRYSLVRRQFKNISGKKEET
jgi:hypothetical protein